MKSDTELIRIPLDGRNVKDAVRNACQIQAGRDPDPRRLAATFVIPTAGNFELLLVFELFDQT